MLPRYPLRYFNAPSPVHREIGSAQHHTAVQEWLQHPGPLHCRMTDKAQLSSANAYDLIVLAAMIADCSFICQVADTSLLCIDAGR